jgi:hypothetical protein
MQLKPVLDFLELLESDDFKKKLLETGGYTFDGLKFITVGGNEYER